MNHHNEPPDHDDDPYPVRYIPVEDDPEDLEQDDYLDYLDDQRAFYEDPTAYTGK